MPDQTGRGAEKFRAMRSRLGALLVDSSREDAMETVGVILHDTESKVEAALESIRNMERSGHD